MKSAIYQAVFMRVEGTEDQSIASRPYGLYLLAFAAAYLFFFCQAVPTYVDEAYSYNLATDKSLSHMFTALRDGADGSFPLYALLVYAWGKVFGASEMSLRLTSGLFVLLFVWHSGLHLKRYFGPAPAALGVAYVMADTVFTYSALIGRCYGLILFLFSLCFWSSWGLIQNGTVLWRDRFWHAVICGLLCLSHPLGIVYMTILGLLYCAFSIGLRRFSVVDGIAFLGGPTLLVAWLPSFMRQRQVNPVYDADLVVVGWVKYWRFAFFDNKVLFFTLIVGSLLLIASRRLYGSVEKRPGGEIDLGQAWSGNQVQQQKAYETVSGPHPHSDQTLQAGDQGRWSGKARLVIYALSFVICFNATVALLDGLRIIPIYWMAAARYVLVCWVAYGVLIAAIMGAVRTMIRRASNVRSVRIGLRLQFLGVFTGLLVLMDLRWSGWFRERVAEQAFLVKVSKIANEGHFRVICSDLPDACYLATRTSTEQVSYLVRDNFPFKRFLLQTAKYYPKPSPIRDLSELHEGNDYLFVNSSPREIRVLRPTRKEASTSE